jgi:DinB family protein
MGIRASLQLFALQRAELTAVLGRISPDDWQRTGGHEQRGTITILDTVRWLVEHEEEHCAQLEAIGQLPA